MCVKGMGRRANRTADAAAARLAETAAAEAAAADAVPPPDAAGAIVAAGWGGGKEAMSADENKFRAGSRTAVVGDLYQVNVTALSWASASR